jgi:CheY-like chemotaxis protein
MEVTVQEAAQSSGKNISDLQERVAIIEKSLSGKIHQKSDVIEKNDLLSILWVDDYPINNAFIIDKLEKEGVRVRKELSTESGLSALSSDKFDIIISDLGRKENGRDNAFAGLDFVKKLRLHGHKHPVLIFAGLRGLDNRERLIEAGANDVTNSGVDVFSFIEKNRPHKGN